MFAAFYGRVSTEEQADRGNISNQVDFAGKYFELNGPAEKIEGFENYLDEGVPGTIPLDKRPEGSRLMTDARAGKISAVYFYRLDRLARSTQIVLNTYNELESLNIIIKSMTEAFDTGTPVGKFFMTLLASIAALERDTILERTQIGKERKTRDGFWTSGPPPFGYRIGPDKKLAVHDPEAETVRLI
ncbi:MAG: recombinase family protein, partial [Desulfocucumaceae bacterium]